MSLDEFVERRKPIVGRKGQGAWYSYKIKHLPDLYFQILEVLEKNTDHWLINAHLTTMVNKVREQRKLKPIQRSTTTGRLSELLGLGYVQMQKGRMCYDVENANIFYTKIPSWQITRNGLIYFYIQTKWRKRITYHVLEHLKQVANPDLIQRIELFQQKLRSGRDQ